MELRFEDSTAFVLSEPLNLRMKISVSGSCKRELLAIIRNDFEHIHQTRWGRSATGKKMGYIDIKIENLENEAEAVIEAFNLKGFDSRVIDGHLKKLFGYDPNGLVRNFIIVYSEAPDFLALWKKYLSHLPKIGFKYPLTGKVQEGNIRFTDIKLARTRHLREGKEVYVYHLFVNMKQ